MLLYDDAFASLERVNLGNAVGVWVCGCRDQCGILKADEVGGWWKIIFPSASFLCAGWLSGDVSWTLVQGFCIGCTFLCFSEDLSVGVVSGFWMT